MAESLRLITPVDGSVYAERPLATLAEAEQAVARARVAQVAWRKCPVGERAALLGRFVDAFLARGEAIAEELTWQIGRPISQSPGELRGFEERARHMIAIAAESLADVRVGEIPGFTRFIRREPLGVVLSIPAWNFPYLTAVNSIVPALLAGNAVILKHSAQTALCGERFAAAFAEAGLPAGLFRNINLDHATTEALIAADGVDYVSFTGSVGGGHRIQAAASQRFIATGLELGGKDPAYVRADADLDFAVENLVDGAFFNSGQSCCGIERIYVHEALYDRFTEAFAETVRGYRLGNPLEPSVNLGPMVRTSAADAVREQVRAATAAGARALIDPGHFPANADGTPYLAPQVLIDVDHQMSVMRDESFGPVVGIMKVPDDAAALELINDSPYGLTASIWTGDLDAGLALGDEVQTGTLFMNRCDYLDPALAWVGVKDSGRGCTLSRVGYEHLTRPKSFHMREGNK
ncbi:aldehyde dehydrogenase family protein [Oceanibacterium hippocampi]|uniref:NADP-dependent glyceraldehyde-3-phosphate dehydrogenase n=1 Tax=Oceanibacterium hippocampi TaxID=745714 RepID=A0A1Y5SI58_9PROT|nr:aldehyde dehydrogenase family protein [Oceanibacterium hippocampi]SLN41381.1 NADP-dependent glyceraldehyde-3-phosphate dehydrogenase [Oceanibacterium hippocampi]